MPRGVRARGIAVAVLAIIASGVSACGDDAERQDADEPAGDFPVEVTSAKYLHGLPDGDVPLSMHFNGTVLYRGDHDRLQVVLVPWSSTTKWRMPLEVWRRAIAAHYPSGGWIRLSDDTLAALSAHKAEQGLHTLDDAVRGLLEDT